MTDFYAGKSLADVLYPDLAAEAAVTRKLLALVPMEHLDWKPHPKSMSLRALASHVAAMPGFSTAMLAMDELVFDPAAWAPKPFESGADLVAIFDAELAAMTALLAQMDGARASGNWKMTMGGYAFIDGQRAFLIRHMGINHLVHHRAQLGVYLRLLDVAIPGSYGPSADTQP